MSDKIKVIISGGGTGGHIFPAISIANALKEIDKDIDILFVGAEGKMEMERVPAAGYPIKGLPVAGLKRSLSLSNLSLPFKVRKSLKMAGKILDDFKPDVVVGVGGYASAPLLWSATRRGIPALIQEQNSYAGLTNKMLGKRVHKICVAYEEMEKFFPSDKIILTGNPIRKEITSYTDIEKNEAYSHFGLDPKKPTILIIGGSLGSRTLNESVMKWADSNGDPDSFQILWQSGGYYKAEVESYTNERNFKNIINTPFIDRMDMAYTIADVIISRAGAGTISELCAIGKATIFVPSPNVAEDHQTHNAMALVNKEAALIIKDSEARDKMMEKAVELLTNPEHIEKLQKNILLLAKADADRVIAEEVIKLSGKTPQAKASKAQEQEQPEQADKIEQKQPGKNCSKVYFLGIGGIGMSAIARYYNFAGYDVSGYDRTPSPLTSSLEKEGISIHYEDNPALIPADVADTLVIYTPAVPADLGEFIYVQEKGYRVIKRSLALGEIASGQKCLAVAGTHGKTTTSTILAHIFQDSGEGCNAFLGGISKNYNTNLLLSKNRVLVAEADEFDRSFLQLFPDTSIITSTDADHLDIYGNLAKMHESFRLFAAQTKRFLIVKDSIDIDLSRDSQARVYRYSFDQKCDFYASDIELRTGGYFNFTLNLPDGGAIKDCTVGIPGWINVENAIAAAASAYLNGIGPEKIRKALASFAGVQRRFDIHINTPECAYIDDYAHHPEEIRAAIGSIRNIFPHRKLCGVFQPHLYSRTKDFYKEFAEALSLLDELILLQIYPARELPLEGVTSKIIFDLVTIESKVLIEKEDLMTELDRHEIDCLATFGAGDIDRFVPQITQYLKRRYNV